MDSLIFIKNIYNEKDKGYRKFIDALKYLGEEFIDKFIKKIEYNNRVASYMVIDCTTGDIPIIIYIDENGRISNDSIIERDFFKRRGLYLNKNTHFNCPNDYKEVVYDKESNQMVWCIYLDDTFCFSNYIVHHIDERIGQINLLNIK